MKKNNIVRKKYEFDNIIKVGHLVKNDCFVVYYYENTVNTYRFGISVGKKIGNAVTRNKYKRKIRNIIDNNKKYYSNKLDYIIIMRRGCIDLKYSEIDEKFVSLIKKINYKGEDNEQKK